MSRVKDDVFKLTNEIEKSPKRKQIVDIYNEFYRSPRYRFNIGTIGKRQHKQFLGYLLIHKQKDNISRNYHEKIAKLDKDTLEGFIYGHNYIKKINEMCLAPLLELIPEAYGIIDPYWEIDQNDSFREDIKIENDIFDNLIRSFQLCEAYKIICSRLSLLPSMKKLKQKDLINGVYGIKESIRKCGLKKCPNDLHRISLRSDMKTAEDVLLSILLSLVYINSSLQCIDQVLFQSLIGNKLIILDHNNVYNIEIAQNALSITYEIYTTERLHFSGDLILINIPFGNQNIKDFCLVEEVKISYSADFGNEIRVGLRGTDDNFSPYGYLIKNSAV